MSVITEVRPASPKAYLYVQVYKSKSDSATIHLRLCADINWKSTHLAVLGALTFNPVLQDFSRRSSLEFFSSSNEAIRALKKSRRDIHFEDDTLCRLTQEKIVQQRGRMRKEMAESQPAGMSRIINAQDGCLNPSCFTFGI